MNSVIFRVKNLVNEETFNELKNELGSYEEWESVYDEILREIDEEDLSNENPEEWITLVKKGPLAVSFRNKKNHLMSGF